MPETPDYPLERESRCPFAPAPVFREMTRAEPVARVRIWDGSTPWFVTRHADQRALLNDPRLSIDEKRPGYPHMTRARADGAPHHPRLITNTDPPEHTRLRRTVNAPFMVKRVEALRPRIQQVLDRLIDDMLAGPRPADLVQAIGLPVPTMVITEILGAPYQDHELFQTASHVLISHDSTPEQAAEAGAELGGYLGDLFAKKMAEPGDDVMSEMAGRVKAGEMDPREAISMAMAILIAGHETSASMISLGTLVLLENPDQLALLREHGDDPKFVANAVEELLRLRQLGRAGVPGPGAARRDPAGPVAPRLRLRRPPMPGPDLGPGRAAGRLRHALPAGPDAGAGGPVRGGRVRHGRRRLRPPLAAGHVVIAVRIEFDEDKCVAAGQCAMVAPALFDQREEDGVSVVLDPAPGPDHHDEAREAAAVCPAGAIRLLEP